MKKCCRILCAALALCLCLGLGAAAADASSAPVAENLELMTYRNVSVGGKLCALDPDGGDLSFEITTEPAKGTVELGEDGYFVYTPKANKRGRDYFGFKAIDSEGNSSQEATVIIKIAKQKTNVCYSDMTGSGDEYAAVWLAENGVFTGESIGGKYVFNPGDALTRGEFLAMCMELCGRELINGVQSTGFADDAQINGWLKPYVSTALIDGVISGLDDGAVAVFAGAEAVTACDAAVMLNSLLGLTNVQPAKHVTDVTVPQWALQPVANLTACDIIDGSGVSSSSLTRAQAAVMLTNAAAFVK